MAGAAQIENPTKAFGLPNADAPTGVLAVVSTETTTTIKRGDVVMFDTADTQGGTVGVKQQTAAGSVFAFVGIALADIGPGKQGIVATGGLVRSVKAQGAIAQYALVQRSGATAGAVASFTPTAATDIGSTIGIALNAAASNLVDLFVRPG